MHKTDTPKHASAAPRTGTPYLSADERAAISRALRDTVPRVSQGGWKPPTDRRDPAELLSESNEGRIMELIPIRFGRMSASPFAFYRGAAALMAADLATTPTSGIRVQAGRPKCKTPSRIATRRRRARCPTSCALRSRGTTSTNCRRSTRCSRASPLARPWEQSTGPMTDEGKALAAGNAMKHGLRSAQWLEERRRVNDMLRECRVRLKRV
jgi:Uncharacterized protein conserved in bacteria (DUF2252)